MAWCTLKGMPKRSRSLPLMACCAALVLGAMAPHAKAQAHGAETVHKAQTPSGLPVPRYVSLRHDTVNGRIGPSLDHPIRWVFHRQGLPVQITAETENWRRVRDPAGDVVWVHRSMVSGRRTVMVGTEPHGGVMLYKSPDETARPVLRLGKGVIATLKSCERQWCQLDVGDKQGWAQAKYLWGLGRQDTQR